MRACKARAIAVLREAGRKWRICGVKSGRVTVTEWTKLGHGWTRVTYPDIDATRTVDLSAELTRP